MTYVFGTSQIHNFVKCPPAIIFANSVSLFEADMVIRRHQDTNRIDLCPCR